YATRDLNQFLDPSDSRDQRVVPFFEECPWTCSKLRRRPPNVLESALQVVRQAFGFGLKADETAQHPDHHENLGHAALIERHDLAASPDELGGDVGLQV